MRGFSCCRLRHTIASARGCPPCMPCRHRCCGSGNFRHWKDRRHQLHMLVPGSEVFGALEYRQGVPSMLLTACSLRLRLLRCYTSLIHTILTGKVPNSLLCAGVGRGTYKRASDSDSRHHHRDRQALLPRGCVPLPHRWPLV